tara:strand:- start:6172 stop:6390 length:219 start_codon:yes stop_codon:yes gene_type:complete
MSMKKKNLEKLIKESLKDIAIRIYDLNQGDRNSLLAEYREWIIKDLNLDTILMLPFEAYTDSIDNYSNDDFD